MRGTVRRDQRTNLYDLLRIGLPNDKESTPPELSVHVVIGRAPCRLVAIVLDSGVYPKLLLYLADNALLRRLVGL